MQQAGHGLRQCGYIRVSKACRGLRGRLARRAARSRARARAGAGSRGSTLARPRGQQGRQVCGALGAGAGAAKQGSLALTAFMRSPCQTNVQEPHPQMREKNLIPPGCGRRVSQNRAGGGRGGAEAPQESLCRQPSERKNRNRSTPARARRGERPRGAANARAGRR
ncbi:MAG: hypothetical protein J3K34DRAFT_5408 [Monoraphidium minutum]|nr:MAG: hypothetical protein J3K34DRAFT_5408 [Monoraphidium minutum]